jgi:NMD protein affecting ribosome stability and mRNA decay
MTTIKKAVTQRAQRVRGRGKPSADPYREQLPPRLTARCSQCGAIYRHKRWQLPDTISLSPREWTRLLSVLCPGCRKMRDRYANGVVTLRWPKQEAARRVILNLIKHQEEWGRMGNPLERIISLETKGDRLTVSTTNERLAQRIGRALERAFHGKVAYQWSRENKLLRVQWAQEAVSV